MIFSSLISYYDRLRKSGHLPPLGFSVEDIGFLIMINKTGELVGEPIDLRTKISANTYEFKPSIVPYSNAVNVRSSSAAEVANFMTDKADYVFGMSGKTPKVVHHESFKALIENVCPASDDVGILAVKAFLKKWQPEDSLDLPLWNEISGMHGKWIAFQLEGEKGFIHEREAVKKCWEAYIAKEEYDSGICFIDGKTHPIQPQYSQFKFGSGASLVSFNKNAYESYGKKRGANAPISVEAEFKSSTALKHLFRNRAQRIKIGDATTVFWTERASPVESFMGVILNPQDDGTDNIPLRKFLEAAGKGAKPEVPDYDGDVKTYILGISLNKARLAVRFWHICSVDQLKDRIGHHFNDLQIERYSEKDIPFPGVWHLLKETARETKDISPVLGGALMRSILEGADYPLNLYNGVLNRIRADQAKKNPQTGKQIPNVNYLRASILKAVLKRNYKMEVPMSLDTEKKDIAYLLGRLFAVLEKAQQDAIPGANATIKDRFYGAASATPASVFPRLLRLAQHHIEKTKSEYGHVSDRRIAEIVEDIKEFPAHLNVKQQGLFAIAYYQQRNEFYKKKTDQKEETINE
ncbi:MAG: type I-C CRISPR-associated protein Cas8c/Csd1 [Thermodesulfobacteriota bacterium]|nr:type I-C CRISPR-associated protein Cas8c/Csd1 [Thermodesulfobacteriota bacterium]